ncbi:MAG TPA: histidine phosphatase family protein [Acidimicrobiia bacterium]
MRHGETTANLVGVWQGWSNAAFSPTGADQVRRLASRLGGSAFDLVVSSDLGRASDTAAALGREFESDRRWRELHLGSWEGLTQDEITSLDAFEAIRNGGDVAFGGGETVTELVARVTEAFTELASRLDPGGRALVVSHGGALFGLVGAILGIDARGKLLRLTNTSMTTLRVGDEGTELVTYNDSAHLAQAPVRAEPDSTHVYLIRHGETEANVAGRWQGRQDGVLTDLGRAQAELLAPVLPQLDVLYTSALGRARDTASILAAVTGHRVDAVSGFEEIGFGDWEGLTSEEIGLLDPAGLAALVDGDDEPRGRSGETLAAAQARMRLAVEDLVGRHHGGAVGVVTHGGSMRALAIGLLGLPFAQRRRIAVVGNTAIGHLTSGASGLAIAAWNLAPHSSVPARP